jgi:hypothetical protein
MGQEAGGAIDGSRGNLRSIAANHTGRFNIELYRGIRNRCWQSDHGTHSSSHPNVALLRVWHNQYLAVAASLGRPRYRLLYLIDAVARVDISLQ